MFPKYINIRPGQLLCAVLGFAINPWAIQAKAARFLAFLNGYSVFLGPVLGSESIPFQPAQPISPRPPNSLPVLLSDYILVRKFAPYHISSLYTPSSIYWYTRGINPRALLTLIIGISPLLPGLIYNIDPLQYAGMNRGILEFYTLS